MILSVSKHFNIVTRHVFTIVSVANSGFPPIGSCNIKQNKVVTLTFGKVAVFDDALNSFVCFCFWFALTHDVRHG